MADLPTIKQLQYFATLAEAGHYRKAAERAGIAQPSLSLQISNLEDTLGLKLVERGRMGAVLTPEGREVLKRAQAIMTEVKTLAEASTRIKSGLIGTLRLGASPTLGPYLLPNVFRKLQQDYPTLRLIIRDAAPQHLLDDLLSGVHDLILTQLPIHSSDVEVARLIREPLQLAVALDHPLAKKSHATDADIAGEHVLLLAPRFTLHNQIADLSRSVGATVQRDYEGTSLDALRQMTAMNMGITFLPALYARSEIPTPGGDVALVPFRKGNFTRSIGLVSRKSTGSSQSFEVFAKTIRAVTAEHFQDIVQLES